MKEKLKIIILLLLFILMLILVKTLLDYENKLILGKNVTNTNISQEVDIKENMVNYQEGNTTQIIEEETMENSVLEVTEESFEKEVLKESKKVLIDFYADWCGPCQVLSPIVEEVAKSNTDVKVVRINIDNAENIAIDYGIMSIPTLVVIEDGKEVRRSVGLISQSEIEALIKF